MKKPGLPILLLIFLSGISCEQTFEPIQESDYNYSIYGYLDLYSNEHWFRVTPVREKILRGANRDSLGLTVTLKREATGSESELPGHIFTFFEDGRDTTTFWNYLSKDSIYQEEDYTITVTGEDGLSSYATTTIPPAYPVPVSEYLDIDKYEGLVTGSGVAKLVVAETVWILNAPEVRVQAFTVTLSQKENITSDGNGNFRIMFNDRERLQELYPPTFPYIEVLDVYMVIASGNESWPESAGTGSEENALPDAQRNVQDGLGVVAGVAAYKISLEPCYDSNNVPEACSPRKIRPSDMMMVAGEQ